MAFFNVAQFTPVTTLPGLAGYKLITDNLNERMQTYSEQPLVKREVDAFKEKIWEVDSADDLMSDFKNFSFVLSAYGLEDQSWATAMVERVLEEDVQNENALANQLQDPKFKDMAEDFQGFLAAKSFAPDVASDIVDRMATKFVAKTYERAVEQSNPEIANAIRFKRSIGDVSNWYQVLGDRQNYEVLRTSLGLPNSVARADIDKQAAQLDRMMNIEDFQDPEKVDEIVNRYLALSSTQSSSTGSSNTALQILQGGSSNGILSNLGGGNLSSGTLQSIIGL